MKKHFVVDQKVRICLYIEKYACMSFKDLWNAVTSKNSRFVVHPRLDPVYQFSSTRVGKLVDLYAYLKSSIWKIKVQWKIIGA